MVKMHGWPGDGMFPTLGLPHEHHRILALGVVR